MSSSYYRKVKATPPPNSYGFKQVSKQELQDIIKRVSRPTYSAKLDAEEQRQVNNYEHLLSDSGRRSVMSSCGKRSAPSSASTSSRSGSTTTNRCNSGKNRRLNERETIRLIRRLQRPTTATTLRSMGGENSEIAYDNEQRNFYTKIGNHLPPSSPKTIAKLRRPTTATLAKALNSCHLCYEHENKEKPEERDAFDYDYSDDKVVPAEEIDYIVGRISAPTHASYKGENNCAKWAGHIDEVKIRENLPLLSGLKRSRNVREITERLSRRNIGYHRHTPQATAITSY